MFTKRLLDILIALLGLLALAPVLVVVGLLVRFKLGSPILFSQLRPGLNGQAFRMWKFRSMTDARAPSGEWLPDSERLPPFGKALRSSSLDELPELWNVLRGEMSIVGPRPLLVSYLPLYSAHQARRHEVRPGITGWAQINGRNALSWEERFDFDVWYVDHRNVWLDLRIIALTFVRVFQKQGVSQPGEATMTAFRGSPAAGRGEQQRA